jgi:hypothetical protein
MTPLKAEYIGADQLPLIIFRLQLCGGPYIPRRGLIMTWELISVFLIGDDACPLLK